VLELQLQNTLLVERQIGLVRDGFPANRVTLPPGRVRHWSIVLPPDRILALDREVGDGARVLTLTGDAEGWVLAALQIRNYHLRAGGRAEIVVLPKGAGAYTAGTRFPAIAIGLCLLALVNVFVPGSPPRAIRLIGHGLGLTAFLMFAACLILPTLSSYEVLLSPVAFAFGVICLYSPLLLQTAVTLVGKVPPFFRTLTAMVERNDGRFAAVAGFWKRHEVTLERGSALAGLAAMAIAQPIFEVVSNSPEFFAARGTKAATALSATVAICFGVPLVLVGIERSIRAVSRSAATAFHGLVSALLIAVIVMPWFRRGNLLGPPLDIVASALIGTILAGVSARSRTVRQFFTALAPAALVVPALFLLEPGVRQTLLPSPPAGAVQAMEQTPPIVFVVFDELPLNSLLDGSGEIDAGRYPNFAALARESYWFRNATTVASNTSHAVPAILSGRYPTAVDDAPTLQYYPVNLFTTLARHYDMFASIAFPLCPPRSCRSDPTQSGDTLESLLSDLGLVWLHIILPETLTEGLPPVTEDWAEFGGHRERDPAAGRANRKDLFARFVSSIDDRPARLYFMHAMVPHRPFIYVPSGRRYPDPDNAATYRRAFEGTSPAFADTAHQRHLAQVGFVDHLIGTLVSRLRERQVYDKALVIITSDHGASYRNGRSRRQPQMQRNIADILRVPLFIKLPGQRRGEVVNRIAETVDILPTILDVVGAKAAPRLDGRSLIQSEAPHASRTFIWRNRFNAEARTIDDSDFSADGAESLEWKERRFGHGIPVRVTPPRPPASARAEPVGAARVAGREGHDSQSRAVRRGRSHPRSPSPVRGWRPPHIAIGSPHGCRRREWRRGRRHALISST
jgi:arylsulfatase A-like enzyme